MSSISTALSDRPYVPAQLPARRVGTSDLDRAWALADAVERMTASAHLEALWPVVLTEALTVVETDGAALLYHDSAPWRVLARGPGRGPTAGPTIDQALLAAAAAGLLDDCGVVPGPEATEASGSRSWRTLLVGAVAGVSRRQTFRLVWFSGEPAWFDAHAEAAGVAGVAEIFARHVGTALAVVTARQTLAEAVEARHRVGQAQGILMGQSGLSTEESFELLRTTSQHQNVKLRQVADEVIRTGRLPTPSS